MSTLLLRQSPAASLLSSWFDRMMGDPSSEAERDAVYRMQPRLDISEDEEKYFVTVDLPGLAKEDVSVTVENGVMKIEGERKEEKKGKYHHTERAYGKFLRSFSLPDDVDASKIEAKAVNGVLELQMPKNKKAKPIEVKIA